MLLQVQSSSVYKVVTSTEPILALDSLDIVHTLSILTLKSNPVITGARRRLKRMRQSSMENTKEIGDGASSSPSQVPANNETEAQDFGRLGQGNQDWNRFQAESLDEDARKMRHDDDEIEMEKPGSPTDHDSSSSSGSMSEDEVRLGRSSYSGRPEVARAVSHVRDGIESRHDVEAALPLEKQPTPSWRADPNLVTWNTEDPENPKTWETRQKWAAVFVVSTFTLISPVSSTMTAPALNSIASELNVTNEFEKQLSLSIFVLGTFPCDRGSLKDLIY